MVVQNVGSILLFWRKKTLIAKFQVLSNMTFYVCIFELINSRRPSNMRESIQVEQKYWNIGNKIDEMARKFLNEMKFTR